MNIKIIYEDEDILAIDKPAGMVVNRSQTQLGKFTVQDWIEKNSTRNVSRIRAIKGEDAQIIEEFIDKNGLSHRLDKETSGVMLISKTLKAFSGLKTQFKERLVEKEYLALVHGRVDPLKINLSKPVVAPKKIARGDERFRYRKIPRNANKIRVPTLSDNVHLKTINYQTFEVSGFMGRNRTNRMRFSMLSEGKESRTIFKVAGYYKNPLSGEALTLLKCYPRSGRTHQIRVHLFSIGHPVLSDETYSGHKQSSTDRKWSPRLFLHASRITISHPRSGAKLRVECDVAEDLTWSLNKLISLNNG